MSVKKQKVYDEILSHTTIGDKNNYLLAPKTVYDFFAFGNGVRKVPDYQRPYSWSANNIQDLLTDIQKLTRDSGLSWFLGPIFTTKNTEEDEISNLLDGQQRVTTLQIIMREAAVIMTKFERFDSDKNADLENRIDVIINACKYSLIKIDIEGPQSRFRTEESISKLFEEYILQIEKIKTLSDYELKKTDFFKKLDTEKSKGSKTAGKIKDSILFVNKFIDKDILGKYDSSIEKLEAFCDYMEALLKRCWLIEIPLKHDDNSIQIFESINNRGKKLSLLDKLRYKSLIKCSDSIREEIKKEWKKTFVGLENLDEWGFIKNEDDFFKVLFNSIKGDDITSENEFIEIYEKLYLTSDDQILIFLEEVKKVITFYELIFKSLDIENQFIEKNFQKSVRKDKVRALLQLLKVALENSDNSRFLLFNLVRKYDFYDQHELIVQGVWTIIRMVFFEEIFSNTKSNVVRTDFLKKISEIESSKLYYSNIINNSEFNYIIKRKSILNALRTTNSSEAKFIIYFYNYLYDHHSLIAGSPDQFNNSEVDHLFPRAWKNSWYDCLYTKDDILDYISKIDPSTFKHINLELLKTELEPLEEVELKDYTTAYFKQPNSIIEFIGNKWVLHSGTNIRTSNKEFVEKKGIYDDDKYVKIPSNQNSQIGINKYSEFTYQEILDRSLAIIDGIMDKFKNEWDNID